MSPPLNKKYGQYLTGLKASGDSELDLKIAMQIKPDIESQVTGKLKLKDNSLQLQNIPKLLTEINGELEIQNQGLSAKLVKANLLGQPSKLSIATKTNKKKILFDKSEEGLFFRFVALSGIEGQKFASMAELEIIPASKK